MRIFLTAALALTFTVPATAETRNFGISDFSKVRVQAPVRVHLQTGVSPFARGEGSAAALGNLDIRVENNVLIVGTSQSSWGGFPGKSSGPVDVYVGTHDIDAGFVLGAGTLDIDRVRGLDFLLTVQGAGGARVGDVAVDQLKLGAAGSATISVAGSAKMLDSALRGLSSLDASKLTVKDMKLVVDGAGTASATVTNSATVTGAGTGAINFAGEPACSLKLQGTGSITGCR